MCIFCSAFFNCNARGVKLWASMYYSWRGDWDLGWMSHTINYARAQRDMRRQVMRENVVLIIHRICLLVRCARGFISPSTALWRVTRYIRVFTSFFTSGSSHLTLLNSMASQPKQCEIECGVNNARKVNSLRNSRVLARKKWRSPNVLNALIMGLSSLESRTDLWYT